MIKGFSVKKNKSTKQIIGAKEIYEQGVETYKNDFLIYFLIKPDNIAVLSTDDIKAKVNRLSSVLKNSDGLEFSCINSRESFDGNKAFYKKRLAEEKNEKIRELLEKDLAHLDRIQVQMASAREFLLIIRLRNYDTETDEVQKVISRMENLLKNENFIARRGFKEDIKKIFSVYFVQDLTQVYFDDFDGERWVKGDAF